MPADDFEAMALALEATGEYRVLRRLKPLEFSPPPPELELRTALLVDVETTGTFPDEHEIIELAMTPLRYDSNGVIHDVGESFQGLRQPSNPIPPEVTAINGITDEMVAGKSIDPAEVAAIVSQANVVIAHNAWFDRRFLERFCDAFKEKAWACSQNEIPWAAEGYEGTKLVYLANASGFFYEKHRAVHDCMATINLLARTLPSGETALNLLLKTARRPTWRIWAQNAPIELKEFLKRRGYRWNATRRVWSIDVPDDKRDSELAFLKTAIYGREITLPMDALDAHVRHSDRY